MQGMNTLGLPHPHRFYCGTTGTGKTTKFFCDWKGSKLPGIHINYTRVPSPFTRVDGGYDIDYLIAAIKRGEKLNYIPALSKPRAKKEIAYIVHSLFECGEFSEKRPFVFALDEAHILAREGERNDMIEQTVTTGRTFGFRVVTITQSPAMVAKILIKQSDVHVVFSVSDYEREYFKTKGMDFDKIQSAVRSADPDVVSHKYMVYITGMYKGPFEEKI